MEGKISLVEFIEEVKRELRAAQQAGKEPMFRLDEVNLEVSFTVDAAAKAEGKLLLVVDLSGEVKASQLHKVSLKLTPLGEIPPVFLMNSGPGIQSGGGIALDNPLAPAAPTDLGDFNPNK